MVMRLILREKNKLNEENSSNETTVKMLASDFLKLTTDEELMDYLRTRFQSGPMDYNPIKAGKLLLLVDGGGKVLSHEGRNRSFANLMKNGERAMQDVILRTERGNINKIETLYGQFDPSISVDIGALEKISEKSSEELPADLLGIGNEPITFETIVIPKGTVYPNGTVLDVDYIKKNGEKDSLFLLNQIYQKLYSFLRKSKGWKSEDFSHHEEVSDAADEYISKTYIVQDEEGVLLPKMKRGSYYRMAYDRPAVGSVTIQKK